MQNYRSRVLVALIAVCALSQSATADTQFAIIADAGRTNANSDLVRNSILRANVQKLILPGDNLYSGTYASVWTPWRTSGLSFDVVAIGNHTGGYRQEVNYFSLPGEYYSTVIGGARFIVLNSDNTATASAQAQWLDLELRRATEPFIFLVYHHPSYTISSFHSWREKEAFQRAIRPLIWAHRSKITALLVGHDHLATLLHFDDLPVVVSGAVHELRRDRPVDSTDGNVSIKTAWFYDRNPYWARLTLQDASGDVKLEYVRATDDKISCTSTLRTGSAAVLQSDCFERSPATNNFKEEPRK